MQLRGVEHGTGADDGLRQRGGDRAHRLERDRRTQRDFEHRQAAGDQRLGDVQRLVDGVEFEYGDDRHAGQAVDQRRRLAGHGVIGKEIGTG